MVMKVMVWNSLGGRVRKGSIWEGQEAGGSKRVETGRGPKTGFWAFWETRGGVQRQGGCQGPRRGSWGADFGPGWRGGGWLAR